ncbi:MAG: biopolymer transporter ExbD [Gammaproteobacteria bacterium]|nr:biopolymer transporter ExbD [Gammaproteobacteria bacterium]
MAFNPQGSRLGSQTPMAEINVIPLVDIMLVLLVIFIITVPVFYQAVPVNLPNTQASPSTENLSAIEVTLTLAGVIQLNQEVISLTTLTEKLRQLTSDAPLSSEVQLRADREVRYQQVTELMAAIQQAGVERIAFVTQP